MIPDAENFIAIGVPATILAAREFIPAVTKMLGDHRAMNGDMNSIAVIADMMTFDLFGHLCCSQPVPTNQARQYFRLTLPPSAPASGAAA